MANVLLGASGSVASVRVPDLHRRLQQAGDSVKVVATRAAQYFFDAATIDPVDPLWPWRNPGARILDEDEWPGRSSGRHYERDDPVLHIELRRWADLLLIAPLDANTLAKLAGGLADNCLTCVWRAWDPDRPVVLAPAMNTLMWQHPLTGRHLRQLCADAGGGDAPAEFDQDEVMGWINERCPQLRVVAPQTKRLACGDVGVGALAELEEIVAAVRALLAPAV